MSIEDIEDCLRDIRKSVKHIEIAVDDAKAGYSGLLSKEDENAMRAIEEELRLGVAALVAKSGGLWSDVVLNLDLTGDDGGENEDEESGGDEQLECPICQHKAILPIGFPEFYGNNSDDSGGGGLKLRFRCHGCKRSSTLYLIYSLDGTGTLMRWA